MIKHHAWRPEDRDAVDAFHEVFYRTERFAHGTWRGVECWKYPTDMLAYAELLFEIKPLLLIEVGSYLGGSALFFQDMLNLASLDGRGKVVSIDVSDRPRPEHRAITWLTGSSLDSAVVDLVSEEYAMARHIDLGRAVMVVLDSDHTEPHVRAEMEAYAPFVTPGSYMVVEDTNLGGHPVIPGWGPGPYEAVEGFLATHGDEWERDRRPERFLLTANPGGWLRRIR